MEEKNYNELDELFRSRILGADEADSNWNLPSDDVFEGAVSALDEKSASKKRFLFFWIAGISLGLFLIALTIWNIGTLDSIDKKMERMIELQENMEQESKKPQTESNTAFSKKSETLDREDTPAPPKTVNNFETTSIQSFHRDAIQEQFDKKRQSQSSEVFEPVRINDIPTSMLPLALHSKTKISFPHNRDFIRTPNILQSSAIEQSIVGQKHQPDNEPEAGSFIGFYIAPNWTSYRMTSTEAMAANLKKYDQWYGGYDVSLFGQKKNSKRMSFNYGLRYSVLHNESSYASEHSYNKSMEQTNGQGVTSYSTDIDIFSSTGLHHESMVLDVSDYSINDQDPLRETTSISNELKMLRADLGLGYTALDLSRLSINVQAQLGLNYLLNATEEMHTSVYYGEDMLMAKDFRWDAQNAFNSFVPSAGIGLNFDYRIKKSWSIGLGILGEQSLQSIQKSDDGQLHFKTISSQFTLKYKL